MAHLPMLTRPSLRLQLEGLLYENGGGKKIVGHSNITNTCTNNTTNTIIITSWKVCLYSKTTFPLTPIVTCVRQKTL